MMRLEDFYRGLDGIVENVRDTLYNLAPPEHLLDTANLLRGQSRYWDGVYTACRFSEVTHCRSASGTIKQATKDRGDDTEWIRETTFTVKAEFDCLRISFGAVNVKLGESGQTRRSLFVSIARVTAKRFLREMQRLGFVPQSASAGCQLEVLRTYLCIFDRLCGFGLLTATSVLSSFMSDVSSGSSDSRALRIRSGRARELLDGKVHNIQLALEELSPPIAIVDMEDRLWSIPFRWESTFVRLKVTRVDHCKRVQATLRQAETDLGDDTDWTREVGISLMAGHDALILQVGERSIRMGEIGTSRQSLFETVSAQGGRWFVERLSGLNFIASSRQAMSRATKEEVTCVFMRLFDDFCGYTALTAVSVVHGSMRADQAAKRGKRLTVAGVESCVTLVEVSG